ncbi:MAG: hypothetical protein HZA22_14120 [Nitrospirae bacterium]|nr:hypothetical protein [Nitrospirota bacterium]
MKNIRVLMLFGVLAMAVGLTGCGKFSRHLAHFSPEHPYNQTQMLSSQPSKQVTSTETTTTITKSTAWCGKNETTTKEKKSITTGPAPAGEPGNILPSTSGAQPNDASITSVSILTQKQSSLTEDMEALEDKYYTSGTTDDDKRLIREKIVFKLMDLMDMYQQKFETELYGSVAVGNSAGDITSLGLSTAASVTSPARVASLLSALSAGILGSTAAVNKNFLQAQAVDLVIDRMEAVRKETRARIIENLKKTTAEYPLGQALLDVQEYARGGTIFAALRAINQDNAKAQDRAELRLQNAEESQVETAAGETVAIKYATIAKTMSDEAITERTNASIAFTNASTARFQNNSSLLADTKIAAQSAATKASKAASESRQAWDTADKSAKAAKAHADIANVLATQAIADAENAIATAGTDQVKILTANEKKKKSDSARSAADKASMQAAAALAAANMASSVKDSAEEAQKEAAEFSRRAQELQIE